MTEGTLLDVQQSFAKGIKANGHAPRRRDREAFAAWQQRWQDPLITVFRDIGESRSPEPLCVPTWAHGYRGAKAVEFVEPNDFILYEAKSCVFVRHRGMTGVLTGDGCCPLYGLPVLRAEWVDDSMRKHRRLELRPWGGQIYKQRFKNKTTMVFAQSNSGRYEYTQEWWYSPVYQDFWTAELRGWLAEHFK